MGFLEVPGGVIAFIEVFIFAVVATLFRKKFSCLRKIDLFTYFWLSFTILTGIWEMNFVLSRDEVRTKAQQLIEKGEEVWTANYDLTYVLPNKLASIFYAEYGAHADREYMTVKDAWSAIIEGTHAFVCAFFSLVGMVGLYLNSNVLTTCGIFAAMGAQLMNSILYMSEYELQTEETSSPNYNDSTFPVGTMWSGRPFMYVNIFWTIFPGYILSYHIFLGFKNWVKERRARNRSPTFGDQPLVELKHGYYHKDTFSSHDSRSSGSDTSSQDNDHHDSRQPHGAAEEISPMYTLDEFVRAPAGPSSVV